MKTRFIPALLLAASLLFAAAQTQAAEKYVIDTEGAHAFIQFRISHLGYSWMTGRFNTLEGSFTWDDENPANSTITVEIDPASIDTNHAERDERLRSADFLDVAKYPVSRFVSTSYVPKEDGTAILWGDFTLHGVTRPIAIKIEPVGHGPDPRGGFRRGFEGRTRFSLKDFAIDQDLGPASRELEILLSIEGVRQ